MAPELLNETLLHHSAEEGVGRTGVGLPHDTIRTPTEEVTQDDIVLSTTLESDVLCVIQTSQTLRKFPIKYRSNHPADEGILLAMAEMTNI